jgi:hypothetical protein
MVNSLDIPLLFERKRRKNGLVLGLLAGLCFGLTSQCINPLLMKGITLYQPPFGAAGNLVLWVAVGGILGFVTAWSDSSWFGVLAGSLLAGLMLQVSAFVSGNLGSHLGGKLVGLVGFFLPFAALAFPLLGWIRLAVNEQREYYDLPLVSWQRLRMPGLLALACLGLGLLWLLPADGQTCLWRMDGMIRDTLAQQTLPKPLQDPLVGPFQERATPRYTLELDRQDLTRYMIPYIPQGQLQPSAVVARFTSGWTLACLYVNPEEEPFCRGYQNLEREISIGQGEGITDDHGFIIK